MPTDPDKPYALREESERRRREKLLEEPHMAPLIKYIANLRSHKGGPSTIPCFDPCDGGVSAQALFLLEAPGPQSVNSRFISRNNPDPTAKNICRLLAEAGILRTDTLLWNVVPWYVGTDTRVRPVNRSDLRSALPYLRQLIELLDRLKVILLLGRKPQLIFDELNTMVQVPVLKSYHPSNLSLNKAPERRGQVLEVFREAATLLTFSHDAD